MLEHLKKERQSGGAQARLRAYMIGLLVLGALILYYAQSGREEGPESLPDAQPSPVEQEARAPVIDRTRLPATDDTAVHARYQPEALAYLLSIVELDFVAVADRLPMADLAALPFAEARGRVFETEGTVEGLHRGRYGGPKDQRLWSILVEAEDGSRVVVLVHALKSDHEEGLPQDARSLWTDYLDVGDRILLRGIYLQRWAGTLGEAIIREPIPVLVATPPTAAFRKLPERLLPIPDPAEADWDDIQDRFLNQTKSWAEPALFQMVEWARTQGYEKIAADIKSGKLEARDWDLALFDAWGEEVATTDPNAERPVTESLRGGFFETTGLVASYLREGWESIPRAASAYGVDKLYMFHLMSDHWGNRVIETRSPWPIETYPGVTGRTQHVRVYGYFVKNYTYTTQQKRGDSAADITMPMFLVLHIEPVPDLVSPYRTMIWVISGIILLLFALFYFVFIRGEKREAERMEAYRRKLRKRIREHGAPKVAATDGGKEDGDAEEGGEKTP